MNISNIIKRKERGQNLTIEELSLAFNGYLSEIVIEADMIKLLKAICKKGLKEEEIISLTELFIQSGDILDLSNLGITVDKHSTGGVGDKTTLIVAPIVAACGVKIAKMSGRALGFTGGTIDKLESIEGFNVSLSKDEFIKQVNDINMAITSQTENFCPMDKKIYALRDISGTTESIGLIAASVMSKKIASGASKILIDIKVGASALIKTKKDAIKLANIMKKIGNIYQKEVICMLTKMDNPLGDNIGNYLEIKEAIDILQNKQNTLAYLSIEMATLLVAMGKQITIDEAKIMVTESINSGKAYDKFLEFVKAQGGVINDIELMPRTKIFSAKKGFVNKINGKAIGDTSMKLGSGRIKKEDEIDYFAGVVLNKNVGDKVLKDDLLCTLYGNKKIDTKAIKNAFNFSNIKPKEQNIIMQII